MSQDNDKLVVQPTSTEELESKLLSEVDASEVKNIIDLFNLNIKKKNVIRTNKLAELQDKISEQMQQRIEHNADAFSNKDLLDYFKTIEDSIKKSDMSSSVQIPVQINQQQVNLNMGSELSRESRNKVIAAIQSILSKNQNDDNSFNDVVDVTPEEEDILE